MEQAEREKNYYEFMVYATSRYTEYIEEGWEVVDAFLKYLDNGRINYIIIFRREKPKEEKLTSSGKEE